MTVAAVLNMMNLNYATIPGTNENYVDQAMIYYAETEFPPKGLYDIYLDPGYHDLFGGKVPAPDDEVLAYVAPGSQLCHVSVSRWLTAAGVDGHEVNAYGIPHKNDRCAKVAGGVAAFVAEMLNGIPGNHQMPNATQSCLACHQLYQPASGYAQQGKLTCTNCHTDNEPHRNNGWR
jgi:hypothetical protein